MAKIVQEIGAAAGLAAVVGVAVLWALHRSQARDVKRLREWAGRAPQRLGPGATAMGRAAAVPVQAGVKPDARAIPQQAVTIPSPRSQRSFIRIATRHVAVALVGLLVLGGAGAYGVTQLTGDDGSRNRPTRNGAVVRPGNVTVAVLNGTTVPGLAAALRDEIAAAGFKKGTINNFSNQRLAESVVQYASGHQAEAKAVSRRLGISHSEPMTASSRGLAGDATVIVIAGADKAP